LCGLVCCGKCEISGPHLLSPGAAVVSEESREEAKRVVMEVSAEEEERREGKEAGRSSVLSDAEEVKVLLEAVGEFLERLRGPLRELVSIMITVMDGAQLGEDVANFYRKLKDSGLPDDVVLEMTRQYFRERLEVANLAGLIARFLKRELLGEEESEKEEEAKS
jgi:hypothetical protein